MTGRNKNADIIGDEYIYFFCGNWWKIGVGFQKGRLYQVWFVAGFIRVQKKAGVVISKYFIFSIPGHIFHLRKVWGKARELGKKHVRESSMA